MGGQNSLEGRVEICLNNNYSRVCDDLWDEQDAKVVCQQLNYAGPGVYNLAIHYIRWILLHVYIFVQTS